MPKNWNGRSKGGTFGHLFFILLIKYTNIHIVYFFIQLIAFYYLLFAAKKNIRFYFEVIHGLKGLYLIKNIYKNYVLLGQMLVDKTVSMLGNSKTFSFNYEGEHILHKLSAEGKGAILIGTHIGNWELAGNLAERFKSKVNVVLLDKEEIKIKWLYEQFNLKRNFSIIPIKEDYSHLNKIIEAINRHEFVIMMGDRVADENSSTVTVDFMGYPAKFPVGPFYIASKYAVPVVFVYAVKEKKFHYHFYASKPTVFSYPANLKTRKEEFTKMLRVYVSGLEKMVKLYPTQWFNYFPFWEKEKINYETNLR